MSFRNKLDLEERPIGLGKRQNMEGSKRCPPFVNSLAVQSPALGKRTRQKQLLLERSYCVARLLSPTNTIAVKINIMLLGSGTEALTTNR